MSYHEHAPPPALVPWIECLWEQRAHDGTPVRVLPDGCIDVVRVAGAGTQIVGANTTAFVVELSEGAGVVGARLRPGAAPALLGVAGEAVRDVRVPIADVWGSEGARLAATLDEHEVPGDGLRAALIARAARAERPDPLVREAVRRLAGPGVAVAQLAGELGLSDRQLRRRMSAAVGYCPKRLARVLRLGRALKAARDGDDLGQAALEAGYADQAHFATDCRALAGVPPTVVLAA